MLHVFTLLFVCLFINKSKYKKIFIVQQLYLLQYLFSALFQIENNIHNSSLVFEYITNPFYKNFKNIFSSTIFSLKIVFKGLKEGFPRGEKS